ncbi:MAG: 3-oxoacyl-ACP reductase FabG [Clostridia bacterium]|nr:3-oxoacyl-ACP reductase FabG [Clostridia bacterium]
MKTVLVTGGSRGIGKAIVEKFAKNGYNVILNYNKSLEAAQKIENEFKNIKIFKADVTNRKEVQAMIDYTNSIFGEIDILINNAGTGCTGLLQDITVEEWQDVFNVNMNGVFNCTQIVLPQMLKKHCGKIINISSIWGMVGASCEVAYSASKAAVIGFTKALAKEIGPSGITVNAIAPGIIMTDMVSQYTLEEFEDIRNQIPLGEIGSTIDIANAVFFLASEEANYITGQIISPNGGWVI